VLRVCRTGRHNTSGDGMYLCTLNALRTIDPSNIPGVLQPQDSARYTFATPSKLAQQHSSRCSHPSTPPVPQQLLIMMCVTHL
jgi:hypothetical protein